MVRTLRGNPAKNPWQGFPSSSPINSGTIRLSRSSDTLPTNPSAQTCSAISEATPLWGPIQSTNTCWDKILFQHVSTLSYFEKSSQQCHSHALFHWITAEMLKPCFSWIMQYIAVAFSQFLTPKPGWPKSGLMKLAVNKSPWPAQTSWGRCYTRPCATGKVPQIGQVAQFPSGSLAISEGIGSGSAHLGTQCNSSGRLNRYGHYLPMLVSQRSTALQHTRNNELCAKMNSIPRDVGNRWKFMLQTTVEPQTWVPVHPKEANLAETYGLPNAIFSSWSLYVCWLHTLGRALRKVETNPVHQPYFS